MTEEIKQTDALTDEETQRLFGWGENIFGLLPHALIWRPKQLHFILYSDGKPVSHVGLLRHVVRVNRRPVTVAGLGGVVTVPEAQKKGMAQRLMQHAAKFLEREWKVDAGLLFCLPRMEAYYSRLGWQTVKAPVTIEQPNGRITSPMPVMIMPLGKTPWPTGDVELESLPW